MLTIHESLCGPGTRLLVKPPPFDYVAPETLDEALEVLAEHGSDAKILAGGQSLIPILNFRLALPAVLVDLNRVTELGYIAETGSGELETGAMTRQSAVESSALAAERTPLVAGTVPWIAHPQIRNRGTVGGCLAHADPAAELPAVAVAHRATFRIRKRDGERRVEARDFYLGLMTPDLAPDEILVEIRWPSLPRGSGWSFVEFARRHGDYALMGLAATLTPDDNGGCREARLVYLSAGEIPIEATEAARLLESEGLSDAAIDDAAALAAGNEIDPTNDIHATASYKRHLARVLTRRALRQARDRARAA